VSAKLDFTHCLSVKTSMTGRLVQIFTLQHADRKATGYWLSTTNGQSTFLKVRYEVTTQQRGACRRILIFLFC